MSSRFYPIYQKGNPQLRVFLPNFWMKLVKPKELQPPNVVQFVVPTGMTNHDIRSYLEKIYHVQVADIKSACVDGKVKEAYKGGYVVKEDDFRRAYVTLPRGQTFQFPDIHTSSKVEQKREDEKALIESEASYKKHLLSPRIRHGLPSWFSV